jgi:hypothetical protein
MRRKKLGVDKCWHRQNMHQQNVGACAEASSCCFGLAKSAIAGFFQTSLMFSFLNMLSSPHAVNKCGVAAGCPAFMGGLSPALYRAHLYRPAMQKHHKHWHQQNIGARQDFRFSPNFSSQYLCSQASYQKLVQAKSNHHHCPISVFLLMTYIQRPPQRCTTWPLSCHKGKGCKRHYHIKVKRGRKQTRFTSALFPKSILSNFPS